MTPASSLENAVQGVVNTTPGTVTISAAALNRLSPEARELLEKLTAEPVEYVANAAFTSAGAERRYFGSEAGEIVAAPNVTPTLSDDPSANGASLSAADERDVFERYNYARYRIVRLLEASAGKTVRGATLTKLLVWAQRAHVLRSALVQANMPLVLAMAKRMRLNGVDFCELISEGNMALLRSVDKFDCSRGFKFSTYACRAIIKSFSRVAMRTSRLHARFPVEYDPNMERSDFAERRREDRRQSCIEELQVILQQNLAKLNDIEQTVIRERFSLDVAPEDGKKAKTLEEIGSIIGVTKERVRQIQNKALRKIRVAMEENYLAA